MPAKSSSYPNAISALTVGYVVALIVIGAIAGAAHVVTSLALSTQASNAAIVNVSGRQRMLSQRIALLATHWTQTGALSDITKLNTAIVLFEKSHDALVAGHIADAEHTVPESVKTVYFDEPFLLDQKAREFAATARVAMEGGTAAQGAAQKLTAMASATDNEPDALLHALNEVVLAYQSDHEHKVEQMELVQNIALIVLFVVLATEAILIFRPLVGRVSELAESLKEAAVTDPMTKCKNRRGFMLSGEILTAQRQHSAVLVMDIDKFKTINDTHGHAAGDACIVHLVEVAKKVFRDGDVFGRIGGEEFAAVLHDICVDDAIDVANRLRETVASTACNVSDVNCDANEICFTVSLGVRAFTEPTPLTDLMQDADAVLYEAKRSGRNRVCATAPRKKALSIVDKSSLNVKRA